MFDTPQDWSERWLSLGTFSFCVEQPVHIRYEASGKGRCFSWETSLYAADDLGLQKIDGWLYYITGGFIGGGIAPSRTITRARWSISGGGECKCK